MKKISLLSFVFLFLTGFGWAPNNEISLPSAGRDDAMIYLPSNYTASAKWPVVLLLHGYMGTSFLIDTYFGFSDQVSKRGFILVVPNGKANSQGRRFWNASPACCDFDQSQSDDIGYLTDLLNKVATTYAVDLNQISAVGHSNGGFMAYKLACAKSSLVHKIVSFAGETDLSASCEPGHAISVLQIQAVDDDTINFNGDPVGYPTLEGYPGAQASVRQWVGLNHCHLTPKTLTPLGLTLSEPGPDTDVFAYEGCDGAARVQLWRIKAYSSYLHFPHTPLLHGAFTDLVLDELLKP